MSNELVFRASTSIDAEPFTTADVIAAYAGISHHAINAEIHKHYDRIKRAGQGKVDFKMQPSQSGQKLKTFLLNEQQATLLITFLKNTPRVADFKEELVKQFFEMRCELMRQQAMFETGKGVSKDLHQAIKDNPNFSHGTPDYINTNRMIYQFALGVSSAQLKKERHFKKGHSITEYLNVDEATAIQRVKERVIMLLEMNLDRAGIKSVLERQGVLYQVTLPVKKGVKQ